MNIRFTTKELDYIAERVAEAIIKKQSTSTETATPKTTKTANADKVKNSVKKTKKQLNSINVTLGYALSKVVLNKFHEKTIITRLSRVTYNGVKITELPIANIANISKASIFGVKGIGGCYINHIEKVLSMYGLTFGEDLLDKDVNYTNFVA